MSVIAMAKIREKRKTVIISERSTPSLSATTIALRKPIRTSERSQIRSNAVKNCVRVVLGIEIAVRDLYVRVKNIAKKLIPNE